MRSFLFTAVFFTLAIFCAISCKSRNYITYYNKVNSIDSIYKIDRDTVAFLKRYKKLFKKYKPPMSIEAVSKYETFIVLSDKHNKNFGEKKSLYKLLDFLAPFTDNYKTLFAICEKYGIDSLSVEKKIANSKNKMNKRLIDSFSVAFVRDQKEGRSDSLTMVINDRKNAKLLKWTIENYGYPSPQKIGIKGNDSVFMPMRTFLSHMSGVSEYYPFFKDKLMDYVKSGECAPQEYATMVDRYERNNKREILYGLYFGDFSDTIKLNRNRRSIGLRPWFYNVKK